MSVIKPILQQPDQIAYFSGANNYCWTYFRDGGKKLLAKPISYIEDQLPAFIRVHKTALVNPTYVTKLYQPPRKKMSGKIYLDGGEVLPVSRRRWDYVVKSLENYTLSAQANEESSVLAATQPSRSPSKTNLLSVYMLTTHEGSHKLAQKVFQKSWPDYQFHTTDHSVSLPHMLEMLSETELPTLLLLDARTATRERLSTLHQLKASAKLRSIPVILFVLPTDQAVIDGYMHQANSVISAASGHGLSDDILERICQFWLHMVRLPTAENTCRFAPFN